MDPYLPANYYAYLIACAFIISVLTSYFAMDMAIKLRQADNYARTVLLVGGSFSMGTGMWTMQFMSILSLDLSIHARYEVFLTLLSLLWPITASLGALLLLSRKDAGFRSLFWAAITQSAGIILMHFTAIASIRFDGYIRYQPLLAANSVGLVLFLLLAAFLWKPLLDIRAPRWRLASSLILGIAVWCIHYFGIRSASFIREPVQLQRHWSFSLTPGMLAIVMGIIIVIIFCLALLFAIIGKQMKTSQSHHQSLFEQNPDMVFSVDTESILLNTNLSVLTTLGYGKRLSMGQSFFKLIVPQDHELFRSYFQKSVQGDSFEFVIQLLHAEGSVRDVFIRTVPMTDGNVTQGVYIIGRDITETKANREKFERLSRTHSLILNSINDGVYGIDAEGRTIFWNAAAERMTGFSYEEVAGTNFHELVRHLKTDLSAVCRGSCPVMLALHEEIPLHVNEELLFRKDGTSFHAEYHVYPIRSEHMPLGAVITFIDITERKRTEELMLSSEKLSVAGQLAAGIAHEIRNPLTAIKGFLQLMNAGVAKKSYIEVIFSEMDRIELIINELLILAKPQPSKREEKPIIPLLNHVIALLDSQANIHNVQLVKEFVEPGPSILCDENQLKQVFINMIKNSIEAMSSGGSVYIRVRQQESGEFTIEVEDQGCGIPPERLSRIGEPFYSTKEKGTGLGLMVSKKILATHGGILHIASEVNKGTKIEVRFPASSSSVSAEEPVASP